MLTATKRARSSAGLEHGLRPSWSIHTEVIACHFRVESSRVTALVAAIAIMGFLGPLAQPPSGLVLQAAEAQTAPTAGCSLSQAAFCETFNAPGGIGDRA